MAKENSKKKAITPAQGVETATEAPSTTETTAMTAPEPQGETAIAAYVEEGEDAAAGFENMEASDILIPSIVVLQANSPQCEGPSAIPNARPGMMYNTATKELIDGKDGFLLVPAFVLHEFVEFKPRDQGGGGGGYVATHDVGSQAVKLATQRCEFGKFKTFDDAGQPLNDLVESYRLFGVVCDGEVATGMVTLAATKTKIKPFKTYQSRLLMFRLTVPGPKGKPVRNQVPIYSHLARVRTVGETRGGKHFYNLVIEPAVGNDVAKSLLRVDDDRRVNAKICYELASSGQVKVDRDVEASSGAGGDGDGEVSAF